MTLFTRGYQETKAILGFKNRVLLTEGVRRIRNKISRLPENYARGCWKAASEK